MQASLAQEPEESAGGLHLDKTRPSEQEAAALRHRDIWTWL